MTSYDLVWLLCTTTERWQRMRILGAYHTPNSTQVLCLGEHAAHVVRSSSVSEQGQEHGDTCQPHQGPCLETVLSQALNKYLTCVPPRVPSPGADGALEMTPIRGASLIL